MLNADEQEIAAAAIAAAAKAFGVSVAEVTAAKRGTQEASWARQEACWLMRRAGVRLESIGFAAGYSPANLVSAAQAAVASVKAHASVRPFWHKGWNAAHERACAAFFAQHADTKLEELAE